jgi:hypothetical protein
VKRFAASFEGQCVLGIADSSQLRGNPHEEYEAWESRGTGNFKNASLLCDIGGNSPWDENR